MAQDYKYVKVWQGYIESGRDAGYPQEKLKVFDSLDALARDPDREEQKIFQLLPVRPEFHGSLTATRKRLAQEDEEEARNKKRKQIEQLRRELGE